MILWHALRRYLRSDGAVYAGYLAFLSLLALLPMMGVLFWLAEQSAVMSTAEVAIRDFLFRNLFTEVAERMLDVLEAVRDNARGFGLTGIAILVFDLVLKALALNAAFDRLWGDSSRRLWHGFVRSVLAVLVLVPALVGAVIWLIRQGGKTLADWVSSETVASVMTPLETALPLIAALYLIYRLGPSRVQPRRSALLAAVLVSALIVIAQYLLARYFAQMHQLRSLYGAFIALPVMMMTAFVLWSLVLYGAALVAEGLGAGPERERRDVR